MICKNNLPNLPKTEAEFLNQHSPQNTIKRLIGKIETGEIIDYFDELVPLKLKLLKQIIITR